MFDYSEKSLSLRRRLLYIPLALHLTLAGCAMVPTAQPIGAPTITTQLGQTIELAGPANGTRSITLRVAPAYKLQDLQHAWIGSDVFAYKLILKFQQNGIFQDFPTPMVITLNQKGSETSSQATFSHLVEGQVYQISLETWGNNGGTAADARLDGQHPQVAEVDFTSNNGNDVEDTRSVTFTPQFDAIDFNGQINVTVGQPLPGGYTNTLLPTFTTTGTTATQTTTLETLTTTLTTVVPTIITSTLTTLVTLLPTFTLIPTITTTTQCVPLGISEQSECFPVVLTSTLTLLTGPSVVTQTLTTMTTSLVTLTTIETLTTSVTV